MKSVTSLSKRFRVSLALSTALAVLPLGSAFHSAQAKPKASAPAYGYRAKQAKSQSKAQKRQNKRARKQAKRDARRDDYRNDDYRRDDYRRDDYRNDDYYDDDYRNNRNGDYRNDDYRADGIEDRVREYFGLFNSR